MLISARNVGMLKLSFATRMQLRGKWWAAETDAAAAHSIISFAKTMKETASRK